MCVSPIHIKITPRSEDKYCSVSKRILKASNLADKTPRVVTVPCGKCIECLKAYQNEWMVRMYHESLHWKFCEFITLTYASPYVPRVYDEDSGEEYFSVRKEDVQKWLKACRSELQRKWHITNSESEPAFKYFLTAEYGPNGTHRPHYHAVIYHNFPTHIFKSVFGERWRKEKGFVDIKLVDKYGEKYKSPLGAFNYVAKYCCKRGFESKCIRWRVDNGKIEKVFHLISKGIGENYVDTKRNYHLCLDLNFDSTQYKIYSNNKDLQGYKDITKDIIDGLKDNEKKDYLHFQEVYATDYIDEIVERKKIIIAGNAGFNYKMPRYYANKIYGEQTALRSEMQERVCKKYDDIYCEQLGELSSQASEDEAIHILAVQEVQDIRTRSKDQSTALIEFYNRARV